MIPFAIDRNLGRACNEAMELLPDDGWACILDHDMAFTTSAWYAQLQEAIASIPDGTFTAVTNRIARSWQRAREADKNNNDMAYHCAIGERRRKQRTLLDVTETGGFGGVLTCVSKRNWRTAGGYADGMYCVDHSLFYRLREHGLRSYLIEGLYVYHRRASSGAKLDAPKVPNCPCDKPFPQPTKRLPIRCFQY